MDPKEAIEGAIAQIEEKSNFEVIAEIKAALNSVYGEERNQITKPSYESVMKMAKDAQISTYLREILSNLDDKSNAARRLEEQVPDALNYQITIHFPEITISNDSDKHLIKNIYVRLFLKPSGTIGSRMQGLRSTVTESEFQSQYLHSHLPRLIPDRIIFNQFCTGIGEINQVLALLNAEYTTANFMMLLMHIKNFLEWESKEGRPHMYIENIFTRSEDMMLHNLLSTRDAKEAAINIIEAIKANETAEDVMEMFKFEVTEREIKVRSTLELERWIASQIMYWNAGYIQAIFGRSIPRRVLLSQRDNTGRYYATPEGQMRMNHQTGPILNFKGREIQFEITERKQTQTNETLANPKITEETCKEFSRYLTKTALSSPGIRSGSSLIYNT